jgi:hypothetical protein
VRILFVAMGHSIHAARWIAQVVGRGWDVHLFPVEDGLNPALRGITVHEALPHRPADLHASVRLRHPLGLRAEWRTWIHGRRRGAEHARDRAAELAHLLPRLRPDVVHSLEMLKAGALVRRARARAGGRLPPWIVSHWGSELFLLGREAHHRRELEAILAECDMFVADCARDVGLARGLGFRGHVGPTLLACGGYDLVRAASLRSPTPPSARPSITLKGYHGWAGRALVALTALERCASALVGFRIAVHSADLSVVEAAGVAARRLRMPIDILPPSAHDEVLRLHGRSRISIGLSISDGMSCSLVEAMVMGSFPVQSDTGGAGAWLTHEANVLFVPPEDPAAVAGALHRALTDDRLVDSGAALNERLVREVFDEALVRPQVVALYEQAAARKAAAS